MISTFYATFPMSFKDYCDAHNIEDAPVEMINTWCSSTVQYYEKDAPSGMVMSLFNIPKDNKKAIEYHEYKIEETGIKIDNEKKIIYVSMTLSITK